MIALEKYPELQEAYEKLEVLSYDEDRVTEYNKRLMWFYDEVSKLECMQEIKDELQETLTELQDTVSKLENTHNQLQNTEQQLQDTKTQLENTAKFLLDMGLSIKQVVQGTGLSEEDVEFIRNAYVRN